MYAYPKRKLLFIVFIFSSSYFSSTSAWCLYEYFFGQRETIGTLWIPSNQYGQLSVSDDLSTKEKQKIEILIGRKIKSGETMLPILFTLQEAPELPIKNSPHYLPVSYTYNILDGNEYIFIINNKEMKFICHYYEN